MTSAIVIAENNSGVQVMMSNLLRKGLVQVYVVQIAWNVQPAREEITWLPKYL